MTGAILSYDMERHLCAWQNTLSSLTATDSFMYNGTRQRVAQQTSNLGQLPQRPTSAGESATALPGERRRSSTTIAALGASSSRLQGRWPVTHVVIAASPITASSRRIGYQLQGTVP